MRCADVPTSASEYAGMAPERPPAARQEVTGFAVPCRAASPSTIVPRTNRPRPFPSPADDFIEEEIGLQRLLVANRLATFLVRVAGDTPSVSG